MLELISLLNNNKTLITLQTLSRVFSFYIKDLNWFW